MERRFETIIRPNNHGCRLTVTPERITLKFTGRETAEQQVELEHRARAVAAQIPLGSAGLRGKLVLDATYIVMDKKAGHGQMTMEAYAFDGGSVDT